MLNVCPSISLAHRSMAAERSTCVRPAVHDQQTVRWKLEGYSWIKSREAYDPCESPELFAIDGLSVGILVYPHGKR